LYDIGDVTKGINGSSPARISDLFERFLITSCVGVRSVRRRKFDVSPVWVEDELLGSRSGRGEEQEDYG